MISETDRGSFAHLNVRTDWTVGGVDTVSNFVKQAADLGMSRIGISDTDSIAGFDELIKACNQRGVEPVFGADFSLVASVVDRRERRVGLIVESREGFDSLARLVELSRKGELEPVDLANNSNGLIGLADTFSYWLLADVLSEDRVYMSLVNYGDRESWERIEEDLAWADSWGASVIATNKVWRVGASGYDGILSKILVARSEGIRLNARQLHFMKEVESREFHPEGWLKPGAMMEELFSFIPSALFHVDEVVERVGGVEKPTAQLPAYPLENGLSALQELERRVELALEDFGSVENQVADRLEYELEIVAEMGLADFFLFADDFVELAGEMEISVFGIGSATGSLLCHVLGITTVDPLAEGLSFERFLNTSIARLPDIDWNVDSRYRDVLMKDWMAATASQGVMLSRIVTRPTYGWRGAIREVMRAFGVKDKVISQVLKGLREGRQIKGDYVRMIGIAEELEDRGLHRGHMPLHPSKVVASDGPVSRPIREHVSSQFVMELDKDEAERWINFDLVGSNALALVEDVCEQLGVKRQALVLDHVMVRSIFINPVGIPYLETPWLTKVLAHYKDSLRRHPDISDLVKALSLSRPGVSRSMGEYFNKLAKQELGAGVELRPFLEETLGLILYQEQVLEIGREMAGLSGVEADELRRAMTKERSSEKMMSLKDRFITGAEGRGFGRDVAEEVFELVARFSAYGFLKGHALALVENIVVPATWLRQTDPEVYFETVLRRGTNFHCVWGSARVYDDVLRRVRQR